MQRIAFFTSFHTDILDYLLSAQDKYELLLVDFSVNKELKSICKKSVSEYIEFHNWLDLGKHILNTDVILSYKLPHIVPEHILKIARNGAYNIHPSLLPKYEGLNPWYDLYYDGVLNTGVTIHRMSSKPDAGEIIIQRKLSIELGESLPSAIKKSEKIAIDMMKIFLNNPNLLHSGKDQRISTQSQSYRTLESIRQLPAWRMWHLFSGFPTLINVVFPILPHKYFKVGILHQNTTCNETRISDDFSQIEVGDGVITLIDTSFPNDDS